MSYLTLVAMVTKLIMVKGEKKPIVILKSETTLKHNLESFI